MRRADRKLQHICYCQSFLRRDDQPEIARRLFCFFGSAFCIVLTAKCGSQVKVSVCCEAATFVNGECVVVGSMTTDDFIIDVLTCQVSALYQRSSVASTIGTCTPSVILVFVFFLMVFHIAGRWRFSASLAVSCPCKSPAALPSARLLASMFT